MSVEAPAVDLPSEQVWAVIPAGGAGTRLWPLSRATAPKFLHDLTGSGRSLIQQTVDGLAAAMLERRDPAIIIGSFAADHVIADERAFRSCVQEAIRVAAADYVVTIGIEPTHPATGFGYIEAGGPVTGVTGAPSARVVRTFVEKPDADRAAAYLRTGRFRWNAGMFVVRVGVLLDLLARWHPDLAAGLRTIAADPGRLPQVWPTLTKIAIDHAVAEPAADAGRVAVVPGSFDWDDVGDFRSLAGLLGGSEHGLRVLGDADRAIGLDASGIVATGGDRVIAVVGLEDVVVVDTPDALLVTTRDRAQDVRRVVDRLKETCRSDLT
jgi:mannose-1-phosphate guanylyltransferase